MARVRKTVYVNATQDQELRPPRGGRTYFFLQNPSAASIYYEEDTMATAENGLEIGAGQTLELDVSQGQSVPQGNVWVRGASAAPAQQRVLVKEG
jgi:hypothetical protein